jgi:site-specific DNA recombinase
VRQLGIRARRKRDKQVAARKKGKWTGGHIILGYDLDARAGKLVINEVEAERVREVFRLYLAGHTVADIIENLDKLGWRNKQWTTRKGEGHGGTAIRRSHVYHLLSNVLYTGRVAVGEETFRGEHPSAPSTAASRI